jgi:hypothetical protein
MRTCRPGRRVRDGLLRPDLFHGAADVAFGDAADIGTERDGASARHPDSREWEYYSLS